MEPDEEKKPYKSDGDVSFGHSKTELANGRSGEFSHEEDDWSSTKILVNLVFVSLSFLFLFTAFQVGLYTVHM